MAMVQDEAKRNATQLSVLLADDHEKTLDSAKEVLETGYRVVATVSNGRLAVEAAESLHPDLIILDITMPELDGIGTARQLREAGSQAKIIFLTVHDDLSYVAAARVCGNGYVLKSRMCSDLPKAIAEALAGRFFVSPHRPNTKRYRHSGLP
jgi:DNA-binding NarL/FixJ family response regulator